MSVPTAVTGWIPKTRIRSGVISEPPPMPVMPTSRPMPKPNMTMMGSIVGVGRGRRRDALVSFFVDRLSQKEGWIMVAGWGRPAYDLPEGNAPLRAKDIG